MSILIVGMEMPKTAFNCSVKVNPDERQCIFTGKIFEETYGLLMQYRCPDCPLAEIPTPHGRLIDADRLTRKEIEHLFYHLPNGDVAVPIIDIQNASTVIESEE